MHTGLVRHNCKCDIAGRRIAEERNLRKAPASDMKIFNFAASDAAPFARPETG
jgi:hypothetical protein